MNDETMIVFECRIKWNNFSMSLLRLFIFGKKVSLVEILMISSFLFLQGINSGLVETDIFKHSPHVTEIIKNMPILKPEDISSAVIYALNMRPEVQVSIASNLSSFE